MMSCSLLLAALVTGCGPVEPTVGSTLEDSQATTVAQSDATGDVNVEALAPATMVAQVQMLSEEIRSLRDQVEILESELDTTRQRQKDLYDDLDNRLRRLERSAPANSGVSTGGTGETTQPDSTASDASDASMTEEGGTPVEVEGGESAVETTVPEAVEVEVDPEVIRAVYDSAFRTLRQGKYEDAIIEFNALVQNYPQSDLVDDAFYWIAEANYVTKKYDVALTGFEQVIRDYPDNRRAAEAMLKIGYIYYDQQDFEQAQNYLEEVIERYPASRSAFSANRRLNKMKRDGNL